jgi:hypothetical protein
MQLDQLISKSDFPVSLLGPGGKIGSSCTAHSLCDLRDGWNEPVVRLSDAKVIAWLRAKVERMRHAFKKVPGLQHHYTKTERAETAEQEKTRLEAVAAQLAKEKADAAMEKKEEPASTVDTPAASPTTPASSSSSASPLSPSPSSVTPASSSLKQSLAFLSEYLPPAFFTLLLASYSMRMEDVFEKKRAATKQWEGAGGGKISGDIDTSRPAGATTSSDNKVSRCVHEPSCTVRVTMHRLRTCSCCVLFVARVCALLLPPPAQGR